MKDLNKYCIASLFIVLSIVLNAQDIAVDLKKINTANQNATDFLAELTVKVFTNDKTTAPAFTQYYKIKKKDKDLFYQIDKKRILVNSKCMVVINDEQKRVMYSDNNNIKNLKVQNMNINVDSLVKVYDEVEYKGVENGMKRYIISQKNNPIPLIEIYFNKTGDQLKKLKYYYDKTLYPVNNLVEIDYTKWDNSPVFKANDFSEKRYLKKINNQWQLLASLGGYKLVVDDLK